jgi:hypothetical protein
MAHRLTCTITFGLLLAGTLTAQQAVFDDHSAFAVLKQLAGEWTGTYDNEPVTLRYEVTAAGSTLVETSYPGGEEEELTLIWMDGDTLVAQHFCTFGNQPRYRFKEANQPGMVSLSFDGGTSLDVSKDSHAHAIEFRLVSEDRFEARYRFWEDGMETETGIARLERVPSK